MRYTVIFLIVCSLIACGRRVISKHWEDGNYRVYARPVSEEIIMGHHMGDGAVLGLSDPTVISAGSDTRYVVFSRENMSGDIEHYYIEKKSNEVGDVSGPYTKDAYDPISKKLRLPEYSWHLPKPRP